MTTDNMIIDIDIDEQAPLPGASATLDNLDAAARRVTPTNASQSEQHGFQFIKSSGSEDDDAVFVIDGGVPKPVTTELLDLGATNGTGATAPAAPPPLTPTNADASAQEATALAAAKKAAIVAAVEAERVKKALSEKQLLKTQKALDKMWEENEKGKFDGLLPYRAPQGFKDSVKLFEYQQDGIRWLLQGEQSPESRVSPFYKKCYLGANAQIEKWRCSVTRKFRSEPPAPDYGSALCDEPGLGKSIQTLGLILSNKRPSLSTLATTSRALGGTNGQPRRCTLIVCPVSVIASWKMQIDAFCEPGLRVEVYVGPKRASVARRLKNKDDVDIVLTSFETLSVDFRQRTEAEEEKAEEKKEKAEEAKQNKKKKRRSEARWGRDEDSEDDWNAESDDDDDDDHYLPASTTRKRKTTAKKGPWIIDLCLWRLVLDEAHKIRNSKTSFFKAATGLMAQHKLVLTATPFVNKVSDIHALVAFLASGNDDMERSNPLVDKSNFKSCVEDPIEKAEEIGLSHVRALMGHIGLRRVKNSVGDLGVPEKTIELHHVSFPEGGWHRQVHDILYTVARSIFQQMVKHGSYGDFFNFFALVGRVRMSCCHAGLIPEAKLEDAGAAHEVLEKEGSLVDLSNKGVSAALLSKLFSIIKTTKKDDNTDEMDIDDIESGNEAGRGDDSDSDDEVAVDDEGPATRRKKGTHFKVNDDWEQSPKTKAVFDVIASMKKDEKGVIFSQWTRHLSIIGHAFTAAGVSFCRIDGSMNAAERSEAMSALQSDDEGSPRFMLCSLLAVGVGVTLTRANVAIMLDCWWNFSVEEQAMDRVHRIGQTRPVRVVRMIMKDSIEERMITLQDAKSSLGNGSLRKLTAEERKRARITALKDLFQLQKQEQKWKGWYKDQNQGEESDDDNDDDDMDDFIVGDDVYD